MIKSTPYINHKVFKIKYHGDLKWPQNNIVCKNKLINLYCIFILCIKENQTSEWPQVIVLESSLCLSALCVCRFVYPKTESRCHTIHLTKYFQGDIMAWTMLSVSRFFPQFLILVPWARYISLTLGTCIVCPRGMQCMLQY